MTVIAPARGADVRTLADLTGRCLDAAWGSDSLDRVLALPGTFGPIARVGSASVGFILYRAAADECELLSFGVLPAHRRRGIGRELFAAARDHAANAGARAMFAEVAEHILSALSLYQSVGFSVVGRRLGYYRSPNGRADAWIMRGSLDQQAIGG